MIDRGVCKTATATPGLLVTHNWLLSDGKMCCGKYYPNPTLTCENNKWMEMYADSVCDIFGPNATCPDGQGKPVKEGYGCKHCKCTQNSTG